MTPDPELDNTIRLPFEDIVDTYFPSLNSLDAFDAAYSEDMIQRIHTKLRDTVSRRPVDDTRHKETILSEAWLDVDVAKALCPGYILNIFDARAETTNCKRHNVYGALISKSDNHLVQQDQPNYFLDDLAVVFKRGGAQHDPWNSAMVVDPDVRADALDQLESHAERHFYFQHRIGLFMLFVNGGEFRVIRWDRSGCIVTEALNYVESPDHTKMLLRFFYAYSQATPEQRGIDITATRLDRDSCGWQWMQKLAAAHAKDLDYSDGTVLDSVPEGFVMKATGDAPTSPLFASSILTEDPTATTGFTDFSSLGDTSALMVPVFKYVRDFFRNSVPETWTCYSLKVRGRHYLVGKPIYASRHLVGRGTRGYVALEWETQRFVFLKDVWRPAHHGVDRTEGETLKILNGAHVPFVPTLVCDEDVCGGSQVTQTSERSATGTKKDRPIAPLPSRPLGATSLSASPQEPPVQTASTSPEGQQPLDTTDSGLPAEGNGTGKSSKRPRSQTTAPVPEPNHKFRPNLRRLTHYRLVIAQVCLPSSAFTSGKQLVRLIWNCIDGHGCAAERCDLLHCDISAGNVLILPIVKVVPSKKRAKGQKVVVVWCGVLGDWELAKKCPGVHELETSSKPRQLPKQRAGTWYFMSVYAIQNPSIPISIADELESFFHVLLYLALRYLRSDLPYPGIFIDEYFASDCRDRHGKAVCGHLKQDVVRRGRLAIDLDHVTFLPDPLPCESDSESQPEDNRNLVLDASRPPSPLNHLFAVLLDHFKAHYAVRKYNAAIKARELQPPKPPVATSPPPATDSTTDSNSDPNSGSQTPSEAIRRLLRMRQIWGDGKARPMSPPKLIKVRPAALLEIPLPPEPSDEEKARAEKLATHQYVKDWFSYIEGGVLWPKEDHVGDQLEGFVHPRGKRFCWATSSEDEDEGGDGDESTVSDWDD